MLAADEREGREEEGEVGFHVLEKAGLTSG
jgi:hypothetical protein